RFRPPLAETNDVANRSPSMASSQHSTRREFFVQMSAGTALCVRACNPPDSRVQTASAPNAAAPTSVVETSPQPSRPSRSRLGVALLGLGKYASEQLAPGLQRTRYCSLT